MAEPERSSGGPVEAAASTEQRFRWQTSPDAKAFDGLAFSDTDGGRGLNATRIWLG